MKHVTTILAGIFCFALSTQAQIKEQFKKESDHNTTTVVIKDSKEVDDMKLLKDSFAMDDYDVGDIIYIATDTEKIAEAEVEVEEEKVAKRSKRPKIKKAKRSGLGSQAGSIAKRKKRPKKKDYAFQSNKSKKSKRPKWDRKCYTW